MSEEAVVEALAANVEADLTEAGAAVSGEALAVKSGAARVLSEIEAAFHARIAALEAEIAKLRTHLGFV